MKLKSQPRLPAGAPAGRGGQFATGRFAGKSRGIDRSGFANPYASREGDEMSEQSPAVPPDWRVAVDSVRSAGLYSDDESDPYTWNPVATISIDSSAGPATFEVYRLRGTAGNSELWLSDASYCHHYGEGRREVIESVWEGTQPPTEHELSSALERHLSEEYDRSAAFWEQWRVQKPGLL